MSEMNVQSQPNLRMKFRSLHSHSVQGVAQVIGGQYEKFLEVLIMQQSLINERGSKSSTTVENQPNCESTDKFKVGFDRRPMLKRQSQPINQARRQSYNEFRQPVRTVQNRCSKIKSQFIKLKSDAPPDQTYCVIPRHQNEINTLLMMKRKIPLILAEKQNKPLSAPKNQRGKQQQYCFTTDGVFKAVRFHDKYRHNCTQVEVSVCSKETAPYLLLSKAVSKNFAGQKAIKPNDSFDKSIQFSELEKLIIDSCVVELKPGVSPLTQNGLSFAYTQTKAPKSKCAFLFDPSREHNAISLDQLKQQQKCPQRNIMSKQIKKVPVCQRKPRKIIAKNQENLITSKAMELLVVELTNE